MVKSGKVSLGLFSSAWVWSSRFGERMGAHDKWSGTEWILGDGGGWEGLVHEADETAWVRLSSTIDSEHTAEYALPIQNLLLLLEISRSPC